MHRTLRFSAMTCFLLCAFCHADAAERVIEITDYTGRGFAPDLVEYTLHGKTINPARIRVLDGNGQLLPSQVVQDGNKTVLCFVAELPANSTVRYTVNDTGGAAVPAGKMKVARTQQGLVLRNGILAVRFPQEIRKTYKQPVRVKDLLPPILAFKSRSSGWLGQSTFLTDKPVKAWRVALTHSGKVYAEVLYEIEWAEGGFYRATIRVIDGVPIVKVMEEYDLKKLDGSHFWELTLTDGWTPNKAGLAATNGNGGVDQGRIIPLDKLMGKQSVRYLVGDHAWGQLLSHIGLFNETDRKQSPDTYPLVGIVPLRKGEWRRSTALEVRSDGVTDVRVRFPMGVRRAIWGKDITSETSPFSTHEHEMALPTTYGRRVWGLALGEPAIKQDDKPFYQLRRLYGIIGLNRYKDFVLDWQAGKVAYPRLYNKTKPSSFSGSDAETKKQVSRALSGLKKMCKFYFTSPTASHHGTCQNYVIAATADDVLGWPNLPPEARRQIRARVALLTYVYEDGDMMSYANGHHHGNPNMGTARFWSGPCFLALIPDHPMFARWLRHMSTYGQYNMSTQIEPGGGYFEFGAAYHMHGYARTSNGLRGLDAAGASNIKDLFTRYHAPDWRYYMNLLTPFDSRWKSRMIPGMANSPPGNTEHLIEAAGGFARHEPELAANLVWAWQANGQNNSPMLPYAPVSIAPKRPALTSQLYPGMGVIFRAHQGPQETYMLFRAGFQWSHWYVDPGHFILYSRGAALVPFQPYQYANSSDKTFDLYNTIRFGHPENVWPHGWGDSVILDHSFGRSVDYAWASTGFPEWFIKPGISPTWQNSPNVTSAGTRKLAAEFKQTEGAFEWNRQIMFLKGNTPTSPNYFVIRDTTPGAGKLASYLYLNLLGTKDDVKTEKHRLAVDTEWPVKLDVLFGQPKSIEPTISEQKLQLSFYGSNLRSRAGKDTTFSRNWEQNDGAPLEKMPRAYAKEKHVIMRIPSKPGDGYFWVLYPRSENEVRPKVSVLRDGVMKIVHPEGTDYVFLSPAAIKYKGKGVVFEGCAGAVRINKTSVTLALTGGPGRAGYKKRVVESAAPFQKTFSLADRETGHDLIPAPKTAIQMPVAAPEEKEITSGVSKSTLMNGILRYRLQSTDPVVFKDSTVRLEGRSAVIEISKGKVRFVANHTGYVKLSVGNKGIRGHGPFDLTFSDTNIGGKVDGKKRSLVCTWPDGIVRPMFHLDGIRYYAGWADDHSIGKGSDTPQFSIGFGVTEGEHSVTFTEWTYPELPPQPEQRSIDL